MARICAFTFDGGGNLAVILAVVTELRQRGHDVDLALTPVAADIPIRRPAYERATATGARLVDVPHDGWRDIPAVDWGSFPPEVREFATAIIAAWTAVAFPAWASSAATVLARSKYDLFLHDLSPGVSTAGEAAHVPSVMLMPQRLPMLRPGLPVPGRGTLYAEMDADEQAAAAERYAHVLDTHALPPLNAARASLGLAPLAHFDDWQSHLDRILVVTSPTFDLIPEPQPHNMRWVGTTDQTSVGASAWNPQWADDDPRPLVVMSPTSTILAQQQLPFVQAAIEAMAALPVRGVVTTGPNLDSTAVRPVGDVMVVGAVRHELILTDAAVMITHAGHGTLMNALRHGTPVVCSPGFADQIDNAARVVDLGLGVRLDHPPSAQDLREAITTVLHGEGFKARVAAMSTHMKREDGVGTACDEIEDLLAAQ